MSMSMIKATKANSQVCTLSSGMVRVMSAAIFDLATILEKENKSSWIKHAELTVRKRLVPPVEFSRFESRAPAVSHPARQTVLAHLALRFFYLSWSLYFSLSLSHYVCLSVSIFLSLSLSVSFFLSLLSSKRISAACKINYSNHLCSVKM